MADPTEVEQDQDDPKESSVIKELRAKAKRVEQAETRAAEAERKLAFHEAGLSGLNDKQVKALLSAHEGDVTAEAIKATADELGFAAKPTETAETETPSEEQQQIGQELGTIGQFAGAPTPEGAALLTQEQIDEKIRSLPPDQLDSWMYENKHLFGIQ